MPLHQWAEKRRRMAKGVTAKPGPYRVAHTPSMREPQESFFDPEVQTTVLCAASRIGKTETEMNLTGYTIDHDPCHILWVYPTLDSAKKWRKEFFNPMIEASPCFRGKIRHGRSRDADNTLLSVAFPGGRCSAIGVNSPSAFRQIQAPRVICEEIDAMDDGPEGDPVLLAFKRADNYPDSIQIVSSSPTIKGRSRIWKWLELSDFRKWFCPCWKCVFRQVWMWRHMKWDEGDPKSARLVCERCGHEHNDRERLESVRAGEWRPTQKFNGIRGYWINGLNTTFSAKKGYAGRLHQFVDEFLTAKSKGREATRTWINTFLAECFDEDPADDIPEKSLLERGEDYSPDHFPLKVLVITAGVDVQGDRLEITVFGWGKDEECWQLEKKQIDGDPEGDEVWVKLDAYLDSKFTREDGVSLGIERAFVDMQFKNKRVIAYCAPRIARGIYPCRGLNRVGLQVPPLLPALPSRNNRARIPHWNIGVTVAKTAIHDRLRLPVGGPRTVHFPEGHGFDVDHFRQLLVEKRKTRYQFGQAYYIFEKENAGQRNEALDMWVYGLAALESLGRVGWDTRASYLLTLAPKKEGPPPPPGAAPAPAQPTPPPRPQMPRRNWATSW